MANFSIRNARKQLQIRLHNTLLANAYVKGMLVEQGGWVGYNGYTGNNQPADAPWVRPTTIMTIDDPRGLSDAGQVEASGAWFRYYGQYVIDMFWPTGGVENWRDEADELAEQVRDAFLNARFDNVNCELAYPEPQGVETVLGSTDTGLYNHRVIVNFYYEGRP